MAPLTKVSRLLVLKNIAVVTALRLKGSFQSVKQSQWCDEEQTELSHIALKWLIFGSNPAEVKIFKTDSHYFVIIKF